MPGATDVRREIVHVGIGKVLEIWSNDPGPLRHLRAWARKAGQGSLGSMPFAGYDRIFVRCLRSTSALKQAALVPGATGVPGQKSKCAEQIVIGQVPQQEVREHGPFCP